MSYIESLTLLLHMIVCLCIVIRFSTLLIVEMKGDIISKQRASPKMHLQTAEKDIIKFKMKFIEITYRNIKLRISRCAYLYKSVFWKWYGDLYSISKISLAISIQSSVILRVLKSLQVIRKNRHHKIQKSW